MNFLLSLLNPTTLIALVIAIVSGGGAWQVQEWRWQSKEKARVQQQLDDERSANAARLRQLEVAAAAQSAARRREAKLVADAVAARGALASVQSAADAAVQAARANHAACIDNATKLDLVFRECAARRVEVARDADGWESEAITQHAAGAVNGSP